MTEEEYNKIRSTTAKETLRGGNESVRAWLNRINNKINEKLSKLEKQREGIKYQEFMEAE